MGKTQWHICSMDAEGDAVCRSCMTGDGVISEARGDCRVKTRLTRWWWQGLRLIASFGGCCSLAPKYNPACPRRPPWLPNCPPRLPVRPPRHVLRPPAFLGGPPLSLRRPPLSPDPNVDTYIGMYFGTSIMVVKFLENYIWNLELTSNLCFQFGIIHLECLENVILNLECLDNLCLHLESYICNLLSDLYLPIIRYLDKTFGILHF